MQPTRTGRVTIPEDPEELRALFLRRMRERDKVHNNPQGPTKRDTASEEGRDTKEPRRTPAKRPGQRPKLYRLIYLTGEEARAIKEKRVTVEEVKSLNENRDDDIPKSQTTIKAEAQRAIDTWGQTETEVKFRHGFGTGPRDRARQDPGGSRGSQGGGTGPRKAPAKSTAGDKPQHKHGTGPRERPT